MDAHIHPGSATSAVEIPKTAPQAPAASVRGSSRRGSAYKGVSKVSHGWKAQLIARGGGAIVDCGVYSSEEEAARAYDEEVLRQRRRSKALGGAHRNGSSLSLAMSEGSTASDAPWLEIDDQLRADLNFPQDAIDVLKALAAAVTMSTSSVSGPSGPSPTAPPSTSHAKAQAAPPTRPAAVSSDGHDEFCSSCSGGGNMVMCDTCHRALHQSCLRPVLHALPPDHELWSCPACQIAKGAVQAVTCPKCESSSIRSLASLEAHWRGECAALAAAHAEAQAAMNVPALVPALSSPASVAASTSTAAGPVRQPQLPLQSSASAMKALEAALRQRAQAAKTQQAGGVAGVAGVTGIPAAVAGRVAGSTSVVPLPFQSLPGLHAGAAGDLRVGIEAPLPSLQQPMPMSLPLAVPPALAIDTQDGGAGGVGMGGRTASSASFRPLPGSGNSPSSDATVDDIAFVDTDDEGTSSGRGGGGGSFSSAAGPGVVARAGTAAPRRGRPPGSGKRGGGGGTTEGGHSEAKGSRKRGSKDSGAVATPAIPLPSTALPMDSESQIEVEEDMIMPVPTMAAGPETAPASSATAHSNDNKKAKKRHASAALDRQAGAVVAAGAGVGTVGPSTTPGTGDLSLPVPSAGGGATGPRPRGRPKGSGTASAASASPPAPLPSPVHPSVSPVRVPASSPSAGSGSGAGGFHRYSFGSSSAPGAGGTHARDSSPTSPTSVASSSEDGGDRWEDTFPGLQGEELRKARARLRAKKSRERKKVERHVEGSALERFGISTIGDVPSAGSSSSGSAAPQAGGSAVTTEGGGFSSYKQAQAGRADSPAEYDPAGQEHSSSGREGAGRGGGGGVPASATGKSTGGGKRSRAAYDAGAASGGAGSGGGKRARFSLARMSARAAAARAADLSGVAAHVSTRRTAMVQRGLLIQANARGWLLDAVTATSAGGLGIAHPPVQYPSSTSLRRVPLVDYGKVLEADPTLLSTLAALAHTPAVSQLLGIYSVQRQKEGGADPDPLPSTSALDTLTGLLLPQRDISPATMQDGEHHHQQQQERKQGEDDDEGQRTEGDEAMQVDGTGAGGPQEAQQQGQAQKVEEEGGAGAGTGTEGVQFPPWWPYVHVYSRRGGYYVLLVRPAPPDVLGMGSEDSEGGEAEQLGPGGAATSRYTVHAVGRYGRREEALLAGRAAWEQAPSSSPSTGPSFSPASLLERLQHWCALCKDSGEGGCDACGCTLCCGPCPARSSLVCSGAAGGGKGGLPCVREVHSHCLALRWQGGHGHSDLLSAAIAGAGQDSDGGTALCTWRCSTCSSSSSSGASQEGMGEGGGSVGSLVWSGGGMGGGTGDPPGLFSPQEAYKILLHVIEAIIGAPHGTFGGTVAQPTGAEEGAAEQGPSTTALHTPHAQAQHGGPQHTAAPPGESVPAALLRLSPATQKLVAGLILLAQVKYELRKRAGEAPPFPGVDRWEASSPFAALPPLLTTPSSTPSPSAQHAQGKGRAKSQARTGEGPRLIVHAMDVEEAAGPGQGVVVQGGTVTAPLAVYTTSAGFAGAHGFGVSLRPFTSTTSHHPGGEAGSSPSEEGTCGSEGTVADVAARGEGVQEEGRGVEQAMEVDEGAPLREEPARVTLHPTPKRAAAAASGIPTRAPGGSAVGVDHGGLGAGAAGQLEAHHAGQHGAGGSPWRLGKGAFKESTPQQQQQEEARPSTPSRGRLPQTHHPLPSCAAPLAEGGSPVDTEGIGTPQGAHKSSSGRSASHALYGVDVGYTLTTLRAIFGAVRRGRGVLATAGIPAPHGGPTARQPRYPPTSIQPVQMPVPVPVPGFRAGGGRVRSSSDASIGLSPSHPTARAAAGAGAASHVLGAGLASLEASKAQPLVSLYDGYGKEGTSSRGDALSAAGAGGSRVAKAGSSATRATDMSASGAGGSEGLSEVGSSADRARGGRTKSGGSARPEIEVGGPGTGTGTGGKSSRATGTGGEGQVATAGGVLVGGPALLRDRLDQVLATRPGLATRAALHKYSSGESAMAAALGLKGPPTAASTTGNSREGGSALFKSSPFRTGSSAALAIAAAAPSGAHKSAYPRVGLSDGAGDDIGIPGSGGLSSSTTGVGNYQGSGVREMLEPVSYKLLDELSHRRRMSVQRALARSVGAVAQSVAQGGGGLGQGSRSGGQAAGASAAVEALTKAPVLGLPLAPNMLLGINALIGPGSEGPTSIAASVLPATTATSTSATAASSAAAASGAGIASTAAGSSAGAGASGAPWSSLSAASPQAATLGPRPPLVSDAHLYKTVELIMRLADRSAVAAAGGAVQVIVQSGGSRAQKAATDLAEASLQADLEAISGTVAAVRASGQAMALLQLRRALAMSHVRLVAAAHPHEHAAILERKRREVASFLGPHPIFHAVDYTSEAMKAAGEGGGPGGAARSAGEGGAGDAAGEGAGAETETGGSAEDKLAESRRRLAALRRAQVARSEGILSMASAHILRAGGGALAAGAGGRGLLLPVDTVPAGGDESMGGGLGGMGLGQALVPVPSLASTRLDMEDDEMGEVDLLLPTRGCTAVSSASAAAGTDGGLAPSAGADGGATGLGEELPPPPPPSLLDLSAEGAALLHAVSEEGMGIEHGPASPSRSSQPAHSVSPTASALAAGEGGEEGAGGGVEGEATDAVPTSGGTPPWLRAPGISEARAPATPSDMLLLASTRPASVPPPMHSTPPPPHAPAHTSTSSSGDAASLHVSASSVMGLSGLSDLSGGAPQASSAPGPADMTASSTGTPAILRPPPLRLTRAPTVEQEAAAVYGQDGEGGVQPGALSAGLAPLGAGTGDAAAHALTLTQILLARQAGGLIHHHDGQEEEVSMAGEAAEQGVQVVAEGQRVGAHPQEEEGLEGAGAGHTTGTEQLSTAMEDDSELRDLLA